jgi:hypothetical protein
MVVEHHMYPALQEWFGSDTPVVAKGLTQQAKAECIVSKLKHGWACVGLDASRFDQCVQAQLLKAEHNVYTRLFPNDRFLAELLSHQLCNKGIGRCRDGFVRADIGAMRCSGDQNTSLGNIVIMCMLIKQFCMENSLLQFDILNDGDDLLLFLPSRCLPLLRGLDAWYLSWGLRMKVEAPAYIPEQVEFCQARPVQTGQGWVLVRNPKKALNTDFACGARCDNWSNYLVHLRSVGICGLSMAAGVPILQELYNFGIRNGRTGKFSLEVLNGLGQQHVIQARSGFKAQPATITSVARSSFEQAFGIPANDQISIEWHLRTMPLSRHGESDTPLLSSDNINSLYTI